LYANQPHLDFYKEILNKYHQMHYLDSDKDNISSPKIYTSVLVELGLKQDNSLQQVGDIKIYPMEYFQPWGENWKKKCFTQNTRTIHHYDSSWLNKAEKEYYYLRKTYGEFWGRVLFIFKHPKLAFKKLKK
jgi:hypothetical protein